MGVFGSLTLRVLESESVDIVGEGMEQQPRRQACGETGVRGYSHTIGALFLGTSRGLCGGGH